MPDSLSSGFFLKLHFMYWGKAYLCRGACAEVTGQVSKAGSFSFHDMDPGLNSGRHLPAEPTHWPYFCCLKTYDS